MSEADRKKWEERYRKRMTEPLGPPDPFLDEILDQLPATGCAMDLAGGSGRHALVLARQGLEVTLTDVAPAGLAIARDAAAAAGLSLHTEIIDLDSDPLPPGPCSFPFCFIAFWRICLTACFVSRSLLLSFPHLFPGVFLISRWP